MEKMALDLRVFALEKAELLSSRLKELLSSGQGYVREQFGVDLGLKPDVYPTWVILSTVAVGLLLLLRLSWAVVCGGPSVGRKRGSPCSQGDDKPGKAAAAPIANPEEPKKKNKKKTVEKNTQSNGKPVFAAQEAVKASEVVSKPAPQVKTEKVQVQALVQMKKKKTKTNVKPVQNVSTNDGKEPDSGAWVTKVSNREKKEQRRKDKGPEDSGSPGGVEAPKSNVEAPANTKKKRGNHVSSSGREEPAVNGEGWTDKSSKSPSQMGAMEGTKWSAIPTATHYRAPSKPQTWGQETQAWSGIDGHIKIDLNPGAFSMLGVNTTDGMAAVDHSSDWNAPDEHWGHYEEPPVLVTAAPPLKEQPVPNKVSADEKDTDSGGADKSKKKRKKKKKTEEERGALCPWWMRDPNPKSLRSRPPKSRILAPPPLRKSEQTVEPPKPSQKKKVRRET
ncbi:Protein LYRIC [Liparis tanakae]|uniref:Protein LYRIC n=1 Tax=Liparis tanakae TaxID=230148 RepID=A0A4Z2G439_9TELE|nr:Protein LYRIC [Liparis tanakae]